MRNTKKWLVLLLTVVMLFNVLGITAMATDNAAPLALEFHPADEAGAVQIDILATDDQIVADGKLVISYDPEVLLFEGIEIGSAWTNAEDVTLSHSLKDSKVILAFACADAANEGVLFSICFSGAVCDTAISLDGSSSYISGTGSVPALGGLYCPSERFTDLAGVSTESHEAADFMVANGYMNGMSQTVFGPTVDLSRAMMVTILYRIAGCPEVAGAPAFSDVSSGSYYTDAVAWAAENSITNGISENLFAPDRALSRQELATFLYRFADYMGYDRSKTADLSGYGDANAISAYAREAFQWAVAVGVIKGTSESTLDPVATTTRMQVSLMVYRLLIQQD